MNHASNKNQNRHMKRICSIYNIDFRMKEFLGWNGERFCGTMKYTDACSGLAVGKAVKCKTTEMLIGPSGFIYKCHRDLYAGGTPIGHILSEEPLQLDIWRRCEYFGECNPCDIKVKTNRFQEYGHTSVEIGEIE